MKPRAPIDWGEFSQAGLSRDVTRAMRLIEKQSSRANASVKFSNGVAEHDETIHDTAILHSFLRTRLWWSRGMQRLILSAWDSLI